MQQQTTLIARDGNSKKKYYEVKLHLSQLSYTQGVSSQGVQVSTIEIRHISQMKY